MHMGDEQRYPSPTDGHTPGPFFARSGDQHGQDDVADDLQLRADLARSLAPIDLGLGLGLRDDDSLYRHLEDNELGILQEGSPTDNESTQAKKDGRHKISKACDECRRKKIKCDHQDSQGTEACSNCKRTGVECAFTRGHLKRGPSKGYIKHLADRLKDLEESQTRMQSAQSEVFSIDDSLLGDVFPTAQELESLQRHIPDFPRPTAQKRTHDAVDDDVDGTPYQQASRPAPAIPQPSNPASVPPSANELVPRPPQSFGSHQYQAFFAAGTSPARRAGVGYAAGSDDGTVIAISDWDDDVVDEYYRIIHQTFPLLPNSKLKLRLRLSSCPAGLREAFVTVLGCYMRTFPSSNLRRTQSYAANMKRACELIAGYPFESPATHTIATNLVYLQTLILMALEADNHGPATVRGQAGPSRAEWLGRAAGVAGQLEINLIRPRDGFVAGDPDTDERLARRIWWVLFILDRWHASSTSDLLKLPENSVVLLPEDQILLGESTYHLARLSFIIGHLASIQTTTKTPETNVMAPNNPASYLLGLTLAGEIDRFRESVESVWGSLNLVHLSYHHCHLLIKRLNPSTEPVELVGHALKVATVLNQRQTPLTPLNHQFGALSAMTLCELVDVDYTRDQALRGLAQLSEALGGGRGLAGHTTESTGWDHAVRLLVERKRVKAGGGGGGGNGNGLGDGVASGGGVGVDGDIGTGDQVRTREQGNVAATAPRGRPRGVDCGAGGTSAGRAGGDFDATRLTMYGYLTALGQGLFQT